MCPAFSKNKMFLSGRFCRKPALQSKNLETCQGRGFCRACAQKSCLGRKGPLAAVVKSKEDVDQRIKQYCGGTGCPTK